MLDTILGHLIGAAVGPLVAWAVSRLNVGGYIGESTRNEIRHAESIGRPVRYLEPPAPHNPLRSDGKGGWTTAGNSEGI
jgi:hypothetical protein